MPLAVKESFLYVFFEPRDAFSRLVFFVDEVDNMSYISIKNVSFAYGGGEPVFSGLKLDLDTDWRLGLVGRNGRGKTTLLNMLAGKLDYSGTISAGVKFIYFPFEVKDEDMLVADVLSELCPDAEQWQILRELSLLNVDSSVLYRPFRTLSGGERTKALLACLFLADDGFPLIDEPTNHLDGEARACVAEYLSSKRGFILVSHDREFLDGCVDHILAITRMGMELVGGTYSEWLTAFETRQAAEAEKNARLGREIDRLNESARQTSAWAAKTEAEKHERGKSGLRPDRGFVGHKAAKLMKRAKTVERHRVEAAEARSKLLRDSETHEQLGFFPLEYRAERLARLCGARVFYDGCCVCAPNDFEIMRGERIALDGANGCGKSSLLKLLAGVPVEYSGTAELGGGLIVSYVPQDASGLCGNIARFARDAGISESLFMGILSRMGFDKRDFDGDMARFSEGQRKKALVARSLCEHAHLYVWDEPLNYLDIYARRQIEEMLLRLKPTMIFAEHDAFFRAAVATRTIKFSPKPKA